MLPISAADFITRVNKGDNINLLDVREAIEYTTYNIGGMNVPLSTMPGSIAGLEYKKTDEIIVICSIGLRSETARQMLTDNCYINVRNLSGGLIALKKINY